MTQTLWIVRSGIEPLNWAFVCDKSKTGNCLPTGFTYEEKDAKKFKTYEGAVRAEKKLHANGFKPSMTETSAAKVEHPETGVVYAGCPVEEPKAMTNNELHSTAIASGRMIIAHVGDKPASKTPVLKSRRFAKVIGNELHVRKYEDPSHGWLAVPMQWLEQFGIVGKISSFSYRRNDTAYLEEDGDMSEFYGAARRAGFTLFVDYRHTDERSPVRSYPAYHVSGFNVEPNFRESVQKEGVN